MPDESVEKACSEAGYVLPIGLVDKGLVMCFSVSGSTGDALLVAFIAQDTDARRHHVNPGA